MDHLPNPLEPKRSQSLTTWSMPPSPEQLDAARRTTKRLIAGFPDYGKAPPDYLVALTECLVHLTPQEHAAVNDPRTGLATVCKYLPTPGDVHEFLRNREAKENQFKPAATSYSYLGPADAIPDPRPPTLEERKAVVMRALGYDPQRKTVPKRDLVRPTDDEVGKVAAGLKTPAKPISPQLRAKLEAEGWPFIPAS
jgi:hypothetical protein